MPSTTPRLVLVVAIALALLNSPGHPVAADVACAIGPAVVAADLRERAVLLITGAAAPLPGPPAPTGAESPDETEVAFVVDQPQDRQGRRRGERRRGGDGTEGTGTGTGERTGGGASGDAKPSAKSAEKPPEEKITLARLFPEKSFFGPSANSAAFSFDGRYGAFLYRPHIERRHGSDLWIHDFETGETRRVTMVSVMSAFQDEARKVRDDRVKKGLEEKKKLAPMTREGDVKETESATRDGTTERDAAAAPPDPVTGTWEGRVTAEAVEFIPPEGIAITVEVLLGEDGAVSGVVKGAGFTVPISEGRWEAERSLLSFALRLEQFTVVARLEATLTDDRAEGSIALEGLAATLRFEATRAAAAKDDAATTTAGATDTKAATADADAGKRDETKAEGAAKDDDAKNRGKHEGKDDETIVRFTARDLGDWVGEKDAEDERAPRYPGISSFEWSPTTDQLIFVSQGDLYRLDVGPDFELGTIERLTRTREGEFDVQWLPDGSGYTYLRTGGGGGGGRDLIRVRFDDGTLEQVNPALTGGESMSGYRLSPDGKRLVFIATRSQGPGSDRRVNIVNYRDRFAQVSQVPRTVSDDPLPKVEQSVYLYDLEGHDAERGLLKKVYSRTTSGPRDALALPHWAPDSTRVAFAVFDQASGRVDIMEASFVEAPKEPEKEEEDDEKEKEEEDGAAEEEKVEGNADRKEEDRTGDDDADKDEDTDTDGADAEKETGSGATAEASTKPTTPKSLADLEEPAKDAKPIHEIRDSRPVYRFLHNGGPNTPRLIEPRYLPDSRQLVFLTELSGFRQLHVLDPIYENLEPLTRGRFEVYPFDMSEDHRRIFALSTRDDPAQQHVWSIEVESGEMRRLTTRDGYHDGAAVSDDGTRVLASHSDFGALRELHAVRVDAENGELSDRRLTDSHPEEARKLTGAVPEYFSYRNRHGQTIHGHMFKPDDWTAEDRRPLLIYVYGGPLGQRKMAFRGATDAASYFFAWYMAKMHGYVTCTIDPRGASGYGGLFEKSNFEQVGKPQVEDLVDGAKWMIENQGVDPKRVGIHGWSFGGFQTQMCLYTEPEVFAVGIAGAGPTEWENYNAWYSTGTIGPSRPGETDLAKFSLLPLAKNLKGRLLLVHGVEDSNVLYQDTVRVYRELLKAGKEHLVDLFIDPTGGHGLGGDVKTLGRYRKYEDFLLLHLGKGEAVKKKEEEAKPAEDAKPEVGAGL